MTFPNKSVAIGTLAFAFILTARTTLAEGTGGIVQEVSGDTAEVAFAGPAPAVGDGVEFFFEMEGVDEVVSVATGKVIAVDATVGTLKVKIENATGDVAKDHLARFTPGKGGPLPTNSPTPRVVVPSPTPVTKPSPSVPFPSVTPKDKVAGPVQNSEETVAAPYVKKGIAQYSAGDIDGAIASYNEGIRIAPSVAVLYLNRAKAYLYKPNFQAAIADANKALELKVSKADDTYTIRGTAKAGLGDYDSALADCNRALKINPKHALAYNNRGNNKLRQRDYSGALTDCNKSIALDSSAALPYYNRGFARTNLGDQAGALADWKKAVLMQASFGAELNPKIAQLGAQGVQAKAASNSKPPTTTTDSGGWTDLTNAPQKMIGTWKGGRHVTQYLADGSFYTDPHLVPNPPRGQWQIQGDRLVEFYPQANLTTTHQILSLDGKTLVVRNAQGESFRKTKIGR